ncbi:MAG: 50S ribosomal protein L11 methyltransferase [Actinomycetota bacterium]
MLELFPEGFAEEPSGQDVELVAFTDEAGARRLGESFGMVASKPVAAGWEEEWKRFHIPVVVGSLWIGPPWAKPEPGLKRVWIDPGQAFGTGSHPTTQLCLEILHLLEPGSVLDVGCGSGVLGIAALTLGFGPVLAIDSDEAAVEATTRNATANSVHLDVRQADALTGPLPDAAIVLANIDLPTLARLTPPHACRLLVTSGYYEDAQPEFSGFGHVARHVQANWAADLFTRG